MLAKVEFPPNPAAATSNAFHYATFFHVKDPQAAARISGWDCSFPLCRFSPLPLPPGLCTPLALFRVPSIGLMRTLAAAPQFRWPIEKG